MKYQVTVKFTRLNVKGRLETSERQGTVEAINKETAREQYMKKFRKNEPSCQQINSIKVDLCK